MAIKLTDAFGTELKRGHSKLELSVQRQIIIRPTSPTMEKRYMKLIVDHYKKEHPIKGFFRELYYKAMGKI